MPCGWDCEMPRKASPNSLPVALVHLYVTQGHDSAPGIFALFLNSFSLSFLQASGSGMIPFIPTTHTYEDAFTAALTSLTRGHFSAMCLWFATRGALSLKACRPADTQSFLT